MTSEWFEPLKLVEGNIMIRTTRRRTLRRNESFDGRIIRSAQDLKSYLKKKGFGDVIIDEDSDNNEV